MHLKFRTADCGQLWLLITVFNCLGGAIEKRSIRRSYSICRKKKWCANHIFKKKNIVATWLKPGPNQ